MSATVRPSGALSRNVCSLPVSYTHLDVYKRQGQQHLLTMFRTQKGWLVADSAKVLAAGLEFGVIDKRFLGRGRPHPCLLYTSRCV